MVAYHLRNIEKIMAEEQITVLLELLKSDPQKIAGMQVSLPIDPMQAELCAILLLLRPQVDAIAQVINAEVLNSKIDTEKLDIYKVYEALKCDNVEEPIKVAVRNCFIDEHLRFLDAFLNMIKHAPALGFYYALYEKSEQGKIGIKVAFIDPRIPKPVSFLPPEEDFEEKHHFRFRALDSNRLSKEIDLDYVYELCGFIDRCLKEIGDTLIVYQLANGRLIEGQAKMSININIQCS
jgi:hypothetical protein